MIHSNGPHYGGCISFYSFYCTYEHIPEYILYWTQLYWLLLHHLYVYHIYVITAQCDLVTLSTQNWPWSIPDWFPWQRLSWRFHLSYHAAIHWVQWEHEFCHWHARQVHASINSLWPVNHRIYKTAALSKNFLHPFSSFFYKECQ